LFRSGSEALIEPRTDAGNIPEQQFVYAIDGMADDPLEGVAKIRFRIEAACFLEEPMLVMSLLLGCFEPATAAASMAFGKPKAIDDAPVRGPERSGGCGGESYLPREEWASAQGEKVSPRPLRLRRSRHSRPSARSSREEAVWPARRIAPSGEDVAGAEHRPQEVRHWRRRKRNPAFSGDSFMTQPSAP
jgi:hypothetical protein